MSNCRIKCLAKSLFSNGHNHDFSEKLSFWETANIVTSVKLSWWAETTSLEKTALKWPNLNNNDLKFGLHRVQMDLINIYNFCKLFIITVFITVFLRHLSLIVPNYAKNKCIRENRYCDCLRLGFWLKIWYNNLTLFSYAHSNFQ